MTTANMSADELFELMYDQAEGRLAPDRAARLEELLLADPVKRQQYVDFMLVVSGLHCTRSERTESACSIDERLPQGASADEPSRDSSVAVRRAPRSSLGWSPIVRFPRLVTPEPGAVYSYVVVAMMMVAGILAAWALTAPGFQGVPVATIAVPVTNAAVTPQRPMIGRITGMANCQWANPAAAAGDALIGRFNLNSGLLELTYENGVKVILEGPAKYVADSANSGFLVFGKATVRVGKHDRRVSAARSPAAVRPVAPTVRFVSMPVLGCPFTAFPSPFSEFSGSSFCLRSRFAKINDIRNAEFGLGADKSGTNQLYVFHGKIDFQLPYDAKVIALEDTEWAFVRFDADHTPWVHFGKAIKSPATFARQLPKNAPLYSQGNKGTHIELGDLPDS